MMVLQVSVSLPTMVLPSGLLQNIVTTNIPVNSWKGTIHGTSVHASVYSVGIHMYLHITDFIFRSSIWGTGNIACLAEEEPPMA
jgi:hypothetical protein